jgi:hypothetical protein
MTREFDDVLSDLSKSAFRRRFRLQQRERRYLADKGLLAVLSHARDFVRQRLAPAHPVNDGRQTPMRGHPAFVGQHATATCCRSCLEKWHGIAKGAPLSEAEMEYVISVLQRWLELRMPSPEGGASPSADQEITPADRHQQTLF